MANPTTNFGWVMPTSTDLVTDLPADFAIFGQAVDTSMAELKGGTTGQVLSKTSNTDMDFTWVAQDDSNAIQNTIVDAKGDLIAASASDVPARLAVGANGETLVADSSTATGLRYQAHSEAGKNFVINGGQDIWQRGTSVASSSIVYTADRFQTWSTGGSATTTSRQATGDTTNLPSIQYCARVQRNSGQTITSAIAYQNSFESVNSIPLAGKTVVFSFYARAGSNFSATSNALVYKVLTGTGTDQTLNSYTGSAEPISATATLTTTWQRFQGTATLSSSATEVGVQVYYTPTGTASTNDYFEITGVQLELGSVASTFSRNGATIQGELAACQRYYYVLADATSQSFGTCAYFTATDALGTVFYPVTMRTAPTFAAAAGAYYEIVRNGAADGLTGLQANFLTTRTANIFADTGNGASGTAGHGGQYRTSSASANIAFSAEL